jgi:hypothetical protein
LTRNPPSTIARGAASAQRRARFAAAACVAALGLILIPAHSAAEDVEPRALPDRIEDVPATRPDPFPAFANFSWRAFVALAWPALTDAAHRGEPDRARRLADPGPRVWETFKSRYEVFQPGPGGGAAAPARWASYDGRNPCGAGGGNRTKTLNAFSAYSDFNQASFAPGVFVGPLVAQNRTYTRYEVRINQAEFDSIVAHQWYRRARLPTAQAPQRIEVGSIAVKAAWRILTDADLPGVRARYYVVKDAEVLDVARSLDAGAGVCGKADVALVGLHIVIKTQYRPQGIWSSFEHVDNVPPVGKGEAREPDARDANAPYSYNDPARDQTDVAPPLGSAATQPLGPANPPRRDPEPAQVIRQRPIGAEIMAMNRAYWALPEIRGTVWANYMLVASQWPTLTQPSAPDNDGAPFPGTSAAPNAPAEIYQLADAGSDPDQNLANTTMETYYQAPAGACMACHHAVSNALGRDFVAFIANDAR